MSQPNKITYLIRDWGAVKTTRPRTVKFYKALGYRVVTKDEFSQKTKEYKHRVKKLTIANPKIISTIINIPKPDESACFNAGYDCGLNGASDQNCHFSFFSSSQNTTAWENGKRAAIAATRTHM